MRSCAVEPVSCGSVLNWLLAANGSFEVADVLITSSFFVNHPRKSGFLPATVNSACVKCL